MGNDFLDIELWKLVVFTTDLAYDIAEIEDTDWESGASSGMNGCKILRIVRIVCRLSAEALFENAFFDSPSVIPESGRELDSCEFPASG